MYKINVGSEKINVSKNQVQEIFTVNAAKMIRKIHRQEGEIYVSAGSLKPEFRPENNQKNSLKPLPGDRNPAGTKIEIFYCLTKNFKR